MTKKLEMIQEDHSGSVIPEVRVKLAKWKTDIVPNRKHRIVPKFCLNYLAILDPKWSQFNFIPTSVFISL